MEANDPKVTRKIRKYHVIIDRGICIGAATCVALAPRAFALDDEAKAILIENADLETDEAILAAAKGCPVSAIKIIDSQTGKQIFP